MPCATDWRYDDQHALQQVTRVACDMAKVLTLGGRFDDLLPSTKDWIRKHNEEDERRKEREEAQLRYAQKRRQMLDGIPLETRRILGLE